MVVGFILVDTGLKELDLIIIKKFEKIEVEE
jgi:hypothetical protein